MSDYSPPNSNSIQAQFTPPYSKPNGGDIELNFQQEALEFDYVLHEAVSIKTEIDTASIYVTPEIKSDEININTQSSIWNIGYIDEVRSDNCTLNAIIEQSVFETLPNIISDNITSNLKIFTEGIRELTVFKFQKEYSPPEFEQCDFIFEVSKFILSDDISIHTDVTEQVISEDELYHIPHSDGIQAVFTAPYHSPSGGNVPFNFSSGVEIIHEITPADFDILIDVPANQISEYAHVIHDEIISSLSVSDFEIETMENIDNEPINILTDITSSEVSAYFIVSSDDFSLSIDFISIISEYFEISSNTLISTIIPDEHTIAISDNIGGSTVNIELQVPTATAEEYFVVQSEPTSQHKTLQKSQVEEYFEISSSTVSCQFIQTGLDIDGNQIDAFKITQIPEIAHATVHARTQFTESNIGGGQYKDFPLGQTGISIRWFKKIDTIDTPHKTIWDMPIIYNNIVTKPFKTTIAAKHIIKSNWRNVQDIHDIAVNKPFEDLVTQNNIHNDSSYIMTMQYNDMFPDIAWDFFIEKDILILKSYIVPEIKDIFYKYPWLSLEYIDCIKKIPYIVPEEKDKPFVIKIGKKWYSHECGTRYFLPKENFLVFKFQESDKFSLEPRLEDIIEFGTFIDFNIGSPKWSDGTDIQARFIPPYDANQFNRDYKIGEEWKEDDPRDYDFYFEDNFKGTWCPYEYYYSGTRDFYAIFIIRRRYVRCMYIPYRRFFFMQNNTIIKKLNTEDEIFFDAIKITTNCMGKYAWDFEISLANQAQAYSLIPDKGYFTDLEIHCNGYLWICKVLSVEESWSFGKKTWVAKGKSPSVSLDYPIVSLSSFINPTSMSAKTLAENIISPYNFEIITNHTSDFNPHTDWELPAKSFNAIESSPIKAIQRLYNTIGYFIYTPYDEEGTIEVRPTYQSLPGDIYNMLATARLTEHVCTSITKQDLIYSQINSIYVTGLNSDKALHVHYNEISDFRYTQPIIDELLTNRESMLQRARHELTQYGHWKEYEITTHIDINQLPLFTPGDILEMDSILESLWRGYVIGVEINISDESVNQIIKTHRYMSNADH